MRFYLYITLLAVSWVGATAHSQSRYTARIDSLRTLLTHATTPEDSLQLLYDISDISDINGKKKLHKSIYNLACRAGNDAARLDILAQMAMLYQGDTTIQKTVVEELKNVPESPDQREALAYARLMLHSSIAQRCTRTERTNLMWENLNRYKQTHPDSLYDRLESLLAVCLYMIQDSQGPLLTSYFNRIENTINRLPREQYLLRNFFYTREAITYTESRRFSEAVEADKNLLEALKTVREKYASTGREFRDFAMPEYRCYRRILSNYKALSERDLKKYYSAMVDLTQIDEDAQYEFDTSPMPRIFYYMGTHDYASALTLLKPFLSGTPPNVYYIPEKVYSMASEAAEQVGDRATFNLATKLYNDELEARKEKNESDNMREIGLMFDYNNLFEAQSDSEKLAQEEQQKEARRIIILCIIAGIVLVILVMYVYNQYRRARKLSEILEARNKELKSERDRLEESRTELTTARNEARAAYQVKSDFISNISYEIAEPLYTIAGFSQMIVDSVDDDKRAYLERYATIISLNIDLVQSLLRDVLNLSEIDSGKMSLSYSQTDVKQLCELVVGGMSLRLQPGVEMIFDAEHLPDVEITTDGRRVEQVLINLLQNAAKFTSSGTISLSYELDPEIATITFAVTDTGVGIAPGKHEKIFERYEKLDPGMQGTGLGLTICRLIARLLKGEVWADPDYSGGARFFFRVPVKQPR